MADYVVPISADAALDHLGLSFPDQVVEGNPVESGITVHDRAGSRTSVGLWESEAGTVDFASYPFDEFCSVVSGRIELVEEGGELWSFGPGDAFVIRKGFRGLWRMPVTTRKYYVEMHG